ncbi:MAG: hypothetical protein QNJ34_11990 [Xenococcaceae cyanobacterium MO_188.B29]|nr:hypothetical protein [Xenococcaceae cyanobacterium MO_188.B29]
MKQAYRLKKHKYLIQVVSIFLGLVLAFYLLFLNINRVAAHRPHDVVSEVKILSDYQQNQTVFIIVRGNLFKSTDGGNSWQRIVKGLDGGVQFSSLSISPSNQKLLFLSSRENGVYKSENEGLSWVQINKGLDNLNIALVSGSPLASDIVLAAGSEKGLYKIGKDGQTWKQVMDNNHQITAIAFTPEDEKSIIIGDNQGKLYLSQDGGNTWKQTYEVKNAGAITTIAVSPNFRTDRTYGIGTEKKGIFKTTDNGLTFEEANQGLSDRSIRDIVFAPNSDNKLTVFASTWDESLFVSEDGAKTWRKFNQGITKDPQADQLKQPHFNKLAVSEDQTLFLGGFNGLFKSTDGGQVWQEIRTLFGGAIVSLDVSPDYINDSTAIAVTYVGFPYITKDGGLNWQAADKGLELPRFRRNFGKVTPNLDPRRFFDVAFSPNYSSDQTIFASILWSKVIRSTNGGKSWKIIPLSREVRGITIAPSPNFAKDKTVYLSNQRGIIFQSTNGGKTFSIISEVGKVFGNDGPSLVISPNFASDKTLYTSGPQGVHKSVDGGKTWQAIAQNTPLTKSFNIQLAISPNYQADKTVMVGTGRGIFVTRNGGENWDKLVNTAYGDNSYIEGLALSPDYKNDQTFLVSVRGKGLFKSINGGKDFTQIGDNSIALARMNNVPSSGIPVKFSPTYAKDRTIYGFGAAGAAVFKSTDAGNTWETLSIPLKNPTYENNKYDLLTSVQLMLYVHQGRILRMIAALIAALLSYILLGLLGLEKKLPLSRAAIKVGGASIIFAVALIILYA